MVEVAAGNSIVPEDMTKPHAVVDSSFGGGGVLVPEMQVFEDVR